MSDDPRGTERLLSTVSETFCLAKWTMATLHLAQGETHSCYHPWTHAVPLEEIAVDPSALHNTTYKKQQRQKMLEGTRPAECQYCWNMEDLGQVSDRMIHSGKSWSLSEFDKIRLAPADRNVTPTNLEVSFSAVCNLKCSYCNPTVSTKWAEEIDQYGGYPTSNNFNGYAKNKRTYILEREHNPYIEAFWKWWPDLYPGLRVLRVTGGEPLLTKHTWRLLDTVAKQPNPALELSINTNMCVPDSAIDRLVAATNGISNNLGSFMIYTSLDATGRRAEYIRHGLNFEQLDRNVKRVLNETNAKLSFMVTFNALSVTDLPNLLDYFSALRHQWPGREIFFDTPYLRYPPHQSVLVLPEKYIGLMDDAISKAESEMSNELEVEKLRRIRAFMHAHKDDDKQMIRADLKRFLDEHDRRRGTNFSDTFPEMSDLFDQP